MDTWYHNMEVMRDDDTHLQSIYNTLRAHLSLCGRFQLRNVHAYPSRTCTYTLDKRRVFVRMRDDAGQRYPDCVLRYVLLHELAHVLNKTTGHDDAFQELLKRLEACAKVGPLCPDNVLPDFNRCH